MLVINREVILSAECFRVAADIAGIALPPLLLPDEVWRDWQEDQVFQASVYAALSAEGVWRGGGLTEEFSYTLKVLADSEREFSAVMDSVTGLCRVHAAVLGQAAVIAYYVPTSGQVMLRPGRADALVEDFVTEFPDMSPGSGLALTAPESGLRRALKGREPDRSARRVLEIASLSRTGIGQIYAGYRDEFGNHHITQDNGCTFYDTERGRYLFFSVEETEKERYFHVIQGSRENLIARIYRLLDDVRNHRDQK